MKQQYSGWRKSTHSQPEANCVEVGRSSQGLIGVRDTKQHGTGPTLEFTQDEWAAFLHSVQGSR